MTGSSRRLRSTLSRYAASVVVGVAVLSMTTGCSDGRPDRVTVSGKVLIDGEPLERGSVVFVPEGGRPSNAKLGPGGEFTLSCFDDDDGALIGNHRVAISAKKIISESNIEWYAPARYSDYRTSGLSFEITERVDDLVIELTWDGEKKPGKR